MTTNFYIVQSPVCNSNQKTLLQKTPSVEIHSLGWLLDQCAESQNKHNCNNQYVLLWCRSGHGRLATCGQQYELLHNAVYCLSPKHSYRLLASESADGYCILLPADFFLQLEHGMGNLFLSNHVAGLLQPAVVQVDEGMQQDMEQVLLCTQREIRASTAVSSEIVKGLVKVFLLYLFRKLAASNNLFVGRDALMVKNFMALLEKKFVRMKRVSDYASELCVSPGYLTQVVKKGSGFTPSHHIQQIVLNEAKRMATLNAHYSMKEIAYSLGFDDLAHFSKFFKANAGANFTSFRKASVG